MKKEKLICIYWIDAHCQNNWQDRKDVSEFAKTAFESENRTFGELIEETKDYYVIGSNFSPKKDLIADIMMIPKIMVKKIKKW